MLPYFPLGSIYYAYLWVSTHTNMHAYFYIFKNMHEYASAYFTLVNMYIQNIHGQKSNTLLLGLE